MIINEVLAVCQLLLATLKAYWPKKIIRIIPVLFIPSNVFNSFVEKCFKLSILTPDKNLALGRKLLLNSCIVSVAKKNDRINSVLL